jgi:hypothetical protein
MRYLTSLTAACLAAALAPAPSLSAAEVTRTLKVHLSGAEAADFAVENLAGTMRVVPGSEGTVTVVATIHAETQSLADAFRLERVAGEGSAAALRVRYPDGVGTIRYRAPTDEDTYQISLGLFSFNSSTYHYDGRNYRISSGHGKRVWADLEVRVPPRPGRARFQNLAGLLEAEGLDGTLRFDVASADLGLRRLGGELSIGGSSGDIRATDIRGNWKSDFSSGDCDLDHFDGDSLSLRTSSGDIHAHDIRAHGVTIETSSGDASFQVADIQEFHGETSSGDLVLEAEGSRLKEIRAQTSSGNVTLRLPRDASFDASADQSSGDMEVGFSDGEAIRHRDKLVAYKRGNGGARIRVETSSGDLEIGPR